MQTLVDFLKAEVDRTSYRDVQRKTGVSRGSLENYIKGSNKDFPKLETFLLIAKNYEIPVYRVLEMAGVDLQLDQPTIITPSGETIDALVDRIITQYDANARDRDRSWVRSQLARIVPSLVRSWIEQTRS